MGFLFLIKTEMLVLLVSPSTTFRLVLQFRSLLVSVHRLLSAPVQVPRLKRLPVTYLITAVIFYILSLTGLMWNKCSISGRRLNNFFFGISFLHSNVHLNPECRENSLITRLSVRFRNSTGREMTVKVQGSSNSTTVGPLSVALNTNAQMLKIMFRCICLTAAP